jgi:hypothetical protein
VSFPSALERQQQAIFQRLGEDAQWDGVAGAVRVIRRSADERLQLDRGQLIEGGLTIRVRKSDVASPAPGQIVQLLDDNGDAIADARFAVSAEPMLNRQGAWVCQVIQASV